MVDPYSAINEDDDSDGLWHEDFQVLRRNEIPTRRGLRVDTSIRERSVENDHLNFMLQVGDAFRVHEFNRKYVVLGFTRNDEIYMCTVKEWNNRDNAPIIEGRSFFLENTGNSLSPYVQAQEGQGYLPLRAFSEFKHAPVIENNETLPLLEFEEARGGPQLNLFGGMDIIENQRTSDYHGGFHFLSDPFVARTLPTPSAGDAMDVEKPVILDAYSNGSILLGMAHTNLRDIHRTERLPTDVHSRPVSWPIATSSAELTTSMLDNWHSDIDEDGPESEQDNNAISNLAGIVQYVTLDKPTEDTINAVMSLSPLAIRAWLPSTTSSRNINYYTQNALTEGYQVRTAHISNYGQPLIILDLAKIGVKIIPSGYLQKRGWDFREWDSDYAGDLAAARELGTWRD